MGSQKRILHLLHFYIVEFFCLHRKFLVYNLVQRNLKLKYRQSILGILWTVLVPAFTALVYFVVFQFVMKVSVPHYLLFLLSGMLPWTFFSTALMTGTESIVGNQPIVNKVPVPVHVFPFTEVVTGFINLMFALPILGVVFLVSGASASVALALVPFYLALLLFQTYGLCLILSVSYVYFRDLRHLLGIIIQLWFYATPIVYTQEMLPAAMKPLMWINPVAYIIEGIHQATVFSSVLSLEKLMIACGWSLALFFVGAFVTSKTRNSLVEGI